RDETSFAVRMLAGRRRQYGGHAVRKFRTASASGQCVRDGIHDGVERSGGVDRDAAFRLLEHVELAVDQNRTEEVAFSVLDASSNYVGRCLEVNQPHPLSSIEELVPVGGF